MKYQLVIQFLATSLGDYDALISLEDLLMDRLGSSADVDGHDFGAGESNIFILTDDPRNVFKQVKPILDERRAGEIRAAFRDVSEEDFIVLWPPELKEFLVS